MHALFGFWLELLQGSLLHSCAHTYDTLAFIWSYIRSLLHSYAHTYAWHDRTTDFSIFICLCLQLSLLRTSLLHSGSCHLLPTWECLSRYVHAKRLICVLAWCCECMGLPLTGICHQTQKHILGSYTKNAYVRTYKTHKQYSPLSQLSAFFVATY